MVRRLPLALKGHNMTKKASLITMLIGLTLIICQPVLASEVKNKIEKTGKMPFVFEEVDASVFGDDYIDSADFKDAAEDDDNAGSLIYESEWDQYACNYFYNNLYGEYRQDAEALRYALNKLFVSDEDTKYTETVLLKSPHSINEAYDFLFRYYYVHPQYYFLKPRVQYSKGKGGYLLRFFLYDKMNDGQFRLEAGQKILDGAAEMKKGIPENAADYEKILTLSNRLCRRVYYNFEFADAETDEETDAVDEEYLTQTVYSALVKDSPVCAGYAQTMSMLLNSLDVDCFCVTSLSHQWNAVRCEDSWYMLDTTWMDTDNIKNGEEDIDYTYFLRDEKKIGGGTYSGMEAHEVEDLWFSPGMDFVLPNFEKDSGSTRKAPKEPTLPERKALAPLITYEETKQGTLVYLTEQEKDCTIFYTTDGSNPSEGQTRCMRYTGEPFYLEDCTVKAIAAKTGCYNSDIVSKDIQGTIKYVLSEECEVDNPNYYYVKEGTLILNDPEINYFKFGGWYLSPAYNEDDRVTSIDTSVGKKYVLYGKLTGDTVISNLDGVPAGSHGICYDFNGTDYGKLTNRNKISFITEISPSGKNVKLPKLQRDGYTFTGWFDNKECLGKKLSSVKKNVTSDVTLYAGWNENSYKITFVKGTAKNTKGAAGKQQAVKDIKFTDSIKLPKCEFVRPGYIFMGWTTDKNGAAAEFADEQSVSALCGKKNGNIKLYAVWEGFVTIQ